LKSSGVNFDAKARRESSEPLDLFCAHVGGMDAFSRGLKTVAAIRKDGRLGKFVQQRYASWDTGLGAKTESGKLTMTALGAYILERGEAAGNSSDRQEFLEILINEFI
jgi:xylose isomerase